MKLFQTCLSLTALLCAAHFAPAQDKTDPAAWVPADAVIYVGITDTQKLWDDYKTTAHYAQLTEFKGTEGTSSANMVNKWIENAKKQLAQALDVDAEQLKNPFGGAFAFYLNVPRGGTIDDLAPGLVAGVANVELMKRYYATAVRKLRDIADDYESVSAGSYTINVFTTDKEESTEEEDDFSDFDEPQMPMSPEALAQMVDDALEMFFSAESMPPKLALCLTDDRLIVADSPDQVKTVLRRARRGESLVDSDLHKTLVRQFKPLGSLRAVVNLPRFFELAQEEAEEPADWFAMMGAKSMRGLIGHIRLGDKAYDGKTETMLLLGGERTGFAKIVSMENRAVTPPKSVSANAVMFGSINVRILTVLDEIEKVLRQTDPNAADMMRSSMEAVPLPLGQMINLRKDFLEHLREPLTANLSFKRPYNAESTRLLLTLGHRAREAMDKLFGSIQPYFVARDVRGNQVYDAWMFGISVSPTSNTLLLGTRAAVETALQSRSDDGLANTAAFKKAAKLAPREAWGTLYIDTVRLAEAAIAFLEHREELQAAGMMNMGARIALKMAEEIAEEAGSEDPQKARALLKYKAPAIFTLSTESDGIRFVAYQLKPEPR